MPPEHTTLTHQTLYPTRESLTQVIDEAMASLPIEGPNQLLLALMTYHNTLLTTLKKENINEPTDS